MDRWATVKRIHQAALDHDGDRRAAFLDRACAGDAALRRDVESLLAYDDRAKSFLELPAMDVAANSMPIASDTGLLGRTLGHYQVRSLLGAGGMGEVYLAHDPRLDRAVALKILPPDLALDADRMQRFSLEARAASALNHPNVATIHDVGDSDGLRFIVMEFVEGETLADAIRSGPLAAPDVVDIGVQVADALEAAHAKGITHRDIKPANVMRTRRGQVKVLDFGVAKTRRTESLATSDVSSTGTHTAVGRVVGSLPYMSPEQVLGREVDHRSDLFSLGVSLYEMATGRLPFAGATATETMDRILHARPEPMTRINADVPSELERLVDTCLEKDVERRHQSARELLIALRDLRRQMDADSVSTGFGAARRHNLPAQLTSFVGRSREIAEIRRLLPTTRLLTLTGAGGCGKTRLALQTASELVDRFRDGVWVVDLGPLSEPNLITHTVAATLGVRGGPNRTLEAALADYFRSRQLLLLLDNCEHLIDECAQLVEPLLRVAPNLHVLATSREGLGIVGETVWRVPSMALPPSSEVATIESVLQYEAVGLFAARAAAVAPAFRITETNAATVADICHRLDGIPLAIELAAARLNVLSADQIAVRLKDRFRLLTGGSRTAVARQRTLEAAIGWSYDLLSEPERTLLCRLSVFPGGWTLDAAEDVCAGNGLERESILDLLSHLVDKSLVNVDDDAGGERRYRCLETVRQYGRERLVRSDDAGRVRERHLEWFSALAQRAEPEITSRNQPQWLNRLHAEYGNLRCALEWCLEPPVRGGTALGLASALAWFWVRRGYLAEGRQWLERALAADDAGSSTLRATGLLHLGTITFLQGELETATRALEESTSLARAVDAHGLVAFSLGLHSILTIESGEAMRGAALAAESLDAAARSGEPWRRCPALECLSYQALHAGDFGRACRLTEEAVALAGDLGDAWMTGMHTFDLALFRLLEGHVAQAQAQCADAFALFREVGDRFGTAGCFAVSAGADAAQGRHVRAARLWGAMFGLLDSMASPLQASMKMMIEDRYIDRVKEALGAEAFERALLEGRAMSLQQAIQYAVADEPPDPDACRSA
jgi:non-specific serine/threonine protein kinase